MFTYYANIKAKLTPFYDVLIPMTGKASLRCEKEFRAEGMNNSPMTTNHAILGRDKWMVVQSDIVYVNLEGATNRVSIGSMFEMAWAKLLNKYVVLALDPISIHRHAFVLEAADIVFNTADEAEDYLLVLAGGNF